MTATVFKSDARIREDVILELERHQRFKPADIGIEVEAGIVALHGTVCSYAKLLTAAEIAASVAGVRGVANELVVRVPGVRAPSDLEVAAMVSGALGLDADLADQRIDVLVRAGVVTLKGSVSYWHERKAAVEMTRRITGVASVRDEIAVVPVTREDGPIENEIRQALRRTIPLAADHVRVSSKNGVVTLEGNVQFLNDRRQAERSAWTTRGVRDVVNSLTTTW